MVDNVSMISPSQVTHNTTELTAATTKGNNHTQNSMDIDTKKITRRKMVERGDDD